MRYLREKQLTTRIRRFTEIAYNTDDPNIHNICMNRLSVLEVMWERWQSDKVSNHRWYDEETDFDKAFKNTVDELIEAEFN